MTHAQGFGYARKRVVFAALLILALGIVQAVCHGAAASAYGGTSHSHTAMAMAPATAMGSDTGAVDSDTGGIVLHTGGTGRDAQAMPGGEAMAGDYSAPGSDPAAGASDSDAASASRSSESCSGSPEDPACTRTNLSACLLVLFAAGGLAVPQKAPLVASIYRSDATTTSSITTAHPTPDLHALGISRT